MWQKTLITFQLSLLALISCHAQGSGLALKFDGKNDYVSLGTSSHLRPSSELTIEFWIKIKSKSENSGLFCNFKISDKLESGYGFLIDENGKLRCCLKTLETDTLTLSDYPSCEAINNTWFHIAGTYDSKTLKLYLNGILQDSLLVNGNIDYFPLPLDARIGQFFSADTTIGFNGAIDELRIWNVAKSASQIQNDFYRTTTTNISSLMAYYSMNSRNDKKLLDRGKNKLNGVLVNMNDSAWVPSGATIGGEGTHLFADLLNDSTVEYTAISGEKLIVKNIQGQVKGIVITENPDQPNTTMGIRSFKGIIGGFYEIFLIGNGQISYDFNLEYSNNEQMKTSETSLFLFNRSNNEDVWWNTSKASLNLENKTILIQKLNGNSQFVVEDASSVLPIELTYFKATNDNGKARIYWETKSELNNDYFAIEHSPDGIHFETIIQIKGQSNGSSAAYYQYIDENTFSGNNYYRLSQTDIDGKSEVFGTVVVTISSKLDFAVYPNPIQVNEKAHIRYMNTTEEDIETIIMTLSGEEIFSKTIQSHGEELLETDIDLANGIEAGNYIIGIKTQGKIISKHLIVN